MTSLDGNTTSEKETKDELAEAEKQSAGNSSPDNEKNEQEHTNDEEASQQLEMGKLKVNESNDNDRRCRRVRICCGCCLLVWMVLAIVLGVLFRPHDESNPLYFQTCTKHANGTSRVGPAQFPLTGPAPGYEQPNLDSIPVYKQALEQIPQLFRHLHIHVIALNKAPRNTERLSGTFQDKPVAILTVKAQGDDTGTTGFFDLGTVQFPNLKSQTPDPDSEPKTIFAWDQKGQIAYKTHGTSSIQFEIRDDDRSTISSSDILLRFSISIDDLPEPVEPSSNVWKDFAMTSEVDPKRYSSLKDSELVFRLKVTEGYHVDKTEIHAMFQDTNETEYREHVLDLKSNSKAVAQAWRNKARNNSKAVLWVIGRNDAFQHPHVGKELFLEEGMDLFVLNWRYNGLNIMRGFLPSPFDASHNPCGEIDLYNEELGLILELIESSGPYDEVLGYAHSAGVAILLNYIIENGDDAFDGFIFNSPFLDWGRISALKELFLNWAPGYLANSDFALAPVETPEAIKDTPVLYLDEAIVISGFWVRRLHSLYYNDWSRRAKWIPATTWGFVRAMNSAFAKIANHVGNITSKPVMVMSSQADPVLLTAEIRDLSKKINSERVYIEYRYNMHDVFLSEDYVDSLKAVADVRSFLVQKQY